jgi:hypothetical protein
MDAVYTGQFWKGLEKAIGKGYEKFKETIVNEVNNIYNNINNHVCLQKYRPHKVESYLAFDAKSVNKAANSSGRGNYRYCFECGLVYLIEHTKNNGYRKVA